MHHHLGSLLARSIKVGSNAYVRSASSSTRVLNSGNTVPWFMREARTDGTTRPVLDESPRIIEDQALPTNLPEHLIALHRHLSQSPLLTPSTLRICKPGSIKARSTTDDLALSYSRIKGRRRRGVHDAGESVGEPDDVWSWGQATLTYMLQGSSQHEDSTGNLGTLKAGDVQWMVAGRGVKHAEMPVYKEGLDIPIGLQLWIDLPAKHKMMSGKYPPGVP
ncbi:hypothetical protein FRC09_001502 [Ceratobasidium sp. 395]|nr:hypothetical protein FRC09_001502 [Ceratobasidium sp. 395]